jgi:hypothetical protein
MEPQPWFENDNFSERENYRAMTEKQRDWVHKYRRDGYIVLEDPGIDGATLDAAAIQLRGAYTQSATGYSTPGRVQDAWQSSPAVREIATWSTVLEALSVLYQKAPVPFQTLNFEYGTEQRAHSDTIHFNTLPYGFMCGVWIALEDIDANNGPLFYYPGSHKLPVFHMSDLGLEPGADRYPQYEDRIERILGDSTLQRETALLKRGQAFIWSANIFHGGSKILDASRTRRSQVTHYYFPGCIYYTPLLSDPENQRWMLRQVKDIRTQRPVPEYRGVEQLAPEHPPKRRRNLLRHFPLFAQHDDRG